MVAQFVGSVNSHHPNLFWMELLKEYYVLSIVSFLFLIIYLLYQHSGDAINPYLAQYSDVCEDSPVSESWTIIKNNMAIKKRVKPLKTHFNDFLIELFVAVAPDIFNWY